MINFDCIPDVSDAELLKLYRWAMATGSAGQTRTIGTHTVTFPATDQLRDTITWLENRIAEDANASTGMGGNVAFAQFGQPT